MREPQQRTGHWGLHPDELDPSLRAALAHVRLVAFDFDGVMTDNRVYVNQDGEESVACSRFDGLGVSRLRALGIASCIISTEANAVVGKRAEKLQMDVEQAVDDKVAAVERFAVRCGVEMSQTAFVGNDINDLPVLRAVGVPIVVADAHPSVLSAARHITQRKGGEGAVREVCDLIADVFDGELDGAF
ncbi:MAG: KdsC family phosphatase [Devosia sp.]